MAAGARKSRNRPIKQKDIRIWMGAYRNIKSRATHKTKSPARRTDNERVNGGPAAMLAWISPKESFLSLTKISYSTALSFICRRVQRTWPQLPTGADLNPLRCRAKSGGDSCGYFRKASWPQKDSNSDEGLKKWVFLNILFVREVVVLIIVLILITIYILPIQTMPDCCIVCGMWPSSFPNYTIPPFHLTHGQCICISWPISPFRVNGLMLLLLLPGISYSFPIHEIDFTYFRQRAM